MQKNVSVIWFYRFPQLKKYLERRKLWKKYLEHKTLKLRAIQEEKAVGPREQPGQIVNENQNLISPKSKVILPCTLGIKKRKSDKQKFIKEKEANILRQSDQMESWREYFQDLLEENKELTQRKKMNQRNHYRI